MEIRRYERGDITQIVALFRGTVYALCHRDYTRAQLDAWAGAQINMEKWHASLAQHDARVALTDGRITGFADMDAGGYLDRLYVHRDHQGQGIATALCDALETASDAAVFSTHASITARTFFERRGYTVQKAQQVERHGVLLTNFVMTKMHGV